MTRRTSQYCNNLLQSKGLDKWALRTVFVGSTNGNQFCEECGHNQETSGSTIICGEDKSAYGNFD